MKAFVVVLIICLLALGVVGCRQTTPATQPPVVALPVSPPPLPLGGLRGIYLSGWAAGSPRIFARNVALIDATTLNAMVIDVKDDGRVSYDVAVPLAREIHANRRMIRNIDQLLATLAQHRIFPIARIACFRDTPLALAHPELAIHTAHGRVFRDGSGHAWLNPYDRRVWDYNVACALDAARQGFKEIQFDYVRFPSEGNTQTLSYQHKPQGVTRQAQIAAFVRYARRQLTGHGVYVSVDVFGLSSKPNPHNPDMGIGQTPTNIAAEVDVLCPMLYPSHYARGQYNIANPNRAPYLIVQRSLRDALRARHTCRLRPWLQDFSLNGVVYGPAQVRAQITALREAGVQEYLLWNARCQYTAAALEPASRLDVSAFPLVR